MSFNVDELREGLGFGAVVTGLEASCIIDPAIRVALYDLWIDRGVLVFRGLTDDEDTQIALSRVFGKPAVHPLKFASDGETAPELADIVFRPERGDIVRIADGPQIGAWLPWHFDLVYVPTINHGGILRPVQLPETGGATGYIDGLDAYQRLSDPLKAEIEGLYVVYHFEGDVTKLRYGNKPEVRLERMNIKSARVMEQIDKYPPVAHPLVFEQQETGRKVLNFSPWFACGIEGKDRAFSDRILNQIVDVLIDEDHAYFLRWEKGDMVLWDNWRIVHCATGVPVEQSRHMQRTAIDGDYGLGRLCDRAATFEDA